MPKLTIDEKTVEVSQGKRMVLALVDDAGVDQMHACGGKAKCTTCRVHFVSGEPTRMTEAEKLVLASRGLLEQVGLRLSCQILCENDMTVDIISTRADLQRADRGARPADNIEPPPQWTTRN
jgi:ferredoxin